jgi:SAM-dependent methyltransferase
MNLYRTKEEHLVKLYGNNTVQDEEEWRDGDNRDKENSWTLRYEYESDIISSIINENNYKSILELGSGPGVLSQKIIEKTNVDYTLIDKKNAKKQFEKRSYKGNFLIKDLTSELNIDGLKTYDLIIANDFLEHITNPSNIITNSYKISNTGGGIFISVPNWRMGHGFIYRGLFDYDNFVYFCDCHGFTITSVYPSPLQCSPSPKLSSESCMDDSLITSWNWYFFGVKK